LWAIELSCVATNQSRGDDPFKGERFTAGHFACGTNEIF
jgi:hypothetical protein